MGDKMVIRSQVAALLEIAVLIDLQKSQWKCWKQENGTVHKLNIAYF